MEGSEAYDCMVVWIIALASLIYCHAISKLIAQGTIRFLSFLPIICLFLFLPLNLTSIHFSGLTSFFVSWLANFKLILFAFGKPPLSSNIPLSLFIPMACLPIKITTTERRGKSPLNYAVKIVLFGLMLMVYQYHEHFHQVLKMTIFAFHIYVSLDLALAAIGYVARALFRVELEPHFDEPYLSTSLQNFWGKRWNLMVPSILHPAVYTPVRSFSSRLIPRKWAPLPGVFAAFCVSGLMHELIFYYMGRLKPTWEVTCFFLMHGVLVVVEVAVKKALNGRYRVLRMLSIPVTLSLVLASSFWLFFPPYTRLNPDVRSCKESVAFIELVMHGRLVAPNDVSCPYFSK